MEAEGPQQNDGVITSIASGRISSPRLYPEYDDHPNSRIIRDHIVLVTYVWYIMSFACVYQFTCML